MDRIQVGSSTFSYFYQFSLFEIVREALRQINIQMIDSSNLYDGLENLWLGSADESLINQQVRSLSLLPLSLQTISFSLLSNNDG